MERTGERTGGEREREREIHIKSKRGREGKTIYNSIFLSLMYNLIATSR